MHLPDDFVAAGIDEPVVDEQVTSNPFQRVKASMNGVVKASEMVNFQRVCYRLYNGSSGSNMKHMCSALGIDVGTPAYMKMAIEIRLRDLQFSEWDVFVPTADDWQLRESDDEVHEKLLDITYTIAQMKGQLQSLVMHRTSALQDHKGQLRADCARVVGGCLSQPCAGLLGGFSSYRMCMGHVRYTYRDTYGTRTVLVQGHVRDS